MGDKVSLSELARLADVNGIVGNKDGQLKGEDEIKFFEWSAKEEGNDELQIQKFYDSGAVIASIPENDLKTEPVITDKQPEENHKNNVKANDKKTKPEAKRI